MRSLRRCCLAAVHTIGGVEERIESEASGDLCVTVLDARVGVSARAQRHLYALLDPVVRPKRLPVLRDDDVAQAFVEIDRREVCVEDLKEELTRVRRALEAGNKGWLQLALELATRRIHVVFVDVADGLQVGVVHIDDNANSVIQLE